MSEQTIDTSPGPTRRVERFWWMLGVGYLLAFGWALWALDLQFSRLLDAPRDLWDYGWLMFSRMTRDDLTGLLESMWTSIAMAWLGTLLASLVAIPMAFLAARNLFGGALSLAVRQVLNLLRAIPEIILIIALIPMLGLRPSAGVMALAIGSIGTLGRLCSEIVEGVDPGPVEAAAAVGGNGIQRLRWGVLPQVIPEMTSFVLYRFEINIRVSAVLGVIGVGGIGTDITDALEFGQFGLAGLAIIIVILATIAVDTISGAVRRRIIRGPVTTSSMTTTSSAPLVIEPM